MNKYKRRILLLLLVVGLGSPGTLWAQEAANKYSPMLQAHGIQGVSGGYLPRQIASGQFVYSFNRTYAWRGSSVLTIATATAPGDSLDYSFGYLATSEILVRLPYTLAGFARTYLVSEINFLYDFDAAGWQLGYSPRLGVELFTARQWSLFFEAGTNLPFYQNAMPLGASGMVVKIGSSYYFGR